MAKNDNLEINKWLKFRLSLKKRIGIYERLKSFTEEEFPIYDSLNKFKVRYDKKGDFRGKVIANWLDRMRSGNSFSKSIRGWVPESELNLIAAGEDGAGIEKGLGEAIKFGKSASKIKSVIIGGSMYPVILMLVIFGFIGMFNIQMAPTYLEFLPLEKWPDSAKYFYMFSDFIIGYWYAILIGIAVSSVVISSTIGKWTGPARNFFDKLPPWSVYKVYQSSSFLISLASMMKSGTPLNDALEKIKKSSDRWLRTYIEEMQKNLRRGGKNFGQHLNVGLLDDETAGDVIDYSELGKFEQAVYTIGEKNLEESVTSIEQKMALARNLMLVVVGLTVGFIYYTSVELNGAVAESATAAKPR